MIDSDKGVALPICSIEKEIIMLKKALSFDHGKNMKNQSRAIMSIIISICLCVSFALTAYSQQVYSSTTETQKEKPMTMKASGAFEVKLTPQASNDKAEGATLGRMSIDKQFHGDLEATSKGEMLTAMTGVKDSAGYVAIERVTGTLHGQSGSFILQHSGTMAHGVQQLTINVVPDSGTGQLAGITGKMTIKIVDGKHFYEFEYTLAKTS